MLEIDCILCARFMKKKLAFYVVYKNRPFEDGEWLAADKVGKDIVGEFLQSTNSHTLSKLRTYLKDRGTRAACFAQTAAPEKFCSLCNDACKNLWLRCQESVSHSLCGTCAREKYGLTDEDIVKFKTIGWTCRNCAKCIYCSKTEPEVEQLKTSHLICTPIAISGFLEC